jgi:hypothetical protein
MRKAEAAVYWLLPPAMQVGRAFRHGNSLTVACNTGQPLLLYTGPEIAVTPQEAKLHYLSRMMLFGWFLGERL